ncbi:MAG: hypothetical protein HY547_01295, partial [Elusimicrobia bacterium]|nr:hypothetical protein [Elusimicrobiota bacterium]
MYVTDTGNSRIVVWGNQPPQLPTIRDVSP